MVNKMKCIPFTLYRTELFSYSEYLKSHNWDNIVSKNMNLVICKDCGILRQHLDGTIDFTFRCIIKEDQDD